MKFIKFGILIALVHIIDKNVNLQETMNIKIVTTQFVHFLFYIDTIVI